MKQIITPAMRASVSSALVEELRADGRREKGPLVFPDALTLLIHNEMAKSQHGEDHVSITEFTSLMLVESCEEETIHEYVALKRYCRPKDNTFARLTLLRGLHHHERYREWMDTSDPDAVRRYAAMLQAIILLRSKAMEPLLNAALEYHDYFSDDKTEFVHTFRDPECADLIFDHPEHWETLISLMLERGYQTAVGVFREMMSNNVTVLNIGTL